MSERVDTAPSMQGVLFIPGAWEVILTGEEARARAVQPLRGRIDVLSAQLVEAHAELAEFHRAHCGDVLAVSACDVCMGRV